MSSTAHTFRPLSIFRKSFSHGIHPAENKHYTEHKPIERLPFPSELYVLLSQHAGKPAVPLVKPGQEVVRGEPVARADGFVSAPLHAPATGVVKRIDLVPTSKGPRKEALVIQVYPGETQEVLYGQDRDIDAMSKQELIQAVQDSGLVGLGGAAFPTHVKLSPPEGHVIDTVLINGCECEPYLTTDQRLMIDQAADLIEGTKILMKILGAPRAIIGTEDNKIASAEAIKKVLPADGTITVQVVRTKYPQGAEKMLAKALVNREIPSGQYPSSVGLAVFNVATTVELGQLLPKGQGVIERVVTITGPGVDKPGNYIVPIGTPLRFIMKKLGYEGSAKHLITGGPMMGDTVSSLDVPITKGCGGFLVLTPQQFEENTLSERFPCISCGSCVDACPMHLNPAQLGKLAAKRMYLDMDKYHLFDCFECGCCSYVCPAGIPLVQYFRVSKKMNREMKAASP